MSLRTSTTSVFPSQIPRIVNRSRDEIDPFPHLRPGRPVKGRAGNHELSRPVVGTRHVSEMEKTLGEAEVTRSTTGKVPGVRGSTGFLESESEAKSRQKELLGGDALQAFEEGRAKEMEIARLRERVTAPLTTQKPDPWTTASQEAYVDLQPVVDRTTTDALTQKPRHVLRKEAAQHPEGPSRFAASFSERNAAVRDHDALASYFKEQQLGESRGAAARVKPPAGWVGGPPQSTYKAHMREFDTADTEGQMSNVARDPVPHKSLLEMSEEQKSFVDHVKQRKAGRNEGLYATTASCSFQDRLAEAEPTLHRRSHYFFKLGDTHQMPKRGNDPLRKPTNMHDTRNTTDIVPSHFGSTKSFHERMAVAGLQP